ncbi:MAG: phosphatidylglycerol lysyltransferase domain-containing protein, partial [Deltaproteobacteria bacterium]
IHPSTADIPGRPPISESLKKGFQKDAAQSLLTAYRKKTGEFLPGIWFDLVQSATQNATPKDRREIARSLLNKLKDFPFDWGPQTRFDQFIDEALGLNADRVTEALNSVDTEELKKKYGEEQIWAGFGNRNLLTPYFEFQNIIEKLNLKPGQLLVDLGSGLGRQGIFLGLTRPDVNFHGYEIVEERVLESERTAKALELPNVKFSRQDLSDPRFKPEAADVYYAFNPVSGSTFLKILNDLREQSVKTKKPFTLVLAFSKDIQRVLEKDSGFQEITPKPNFEEDDFARFFRFDPSEPWTPFGSSQILQQRELDRNLSSVGATLNSPPPALNSRARPLEFSDRTEVTRLMEKSGKFHSNLDFVSLWSWNPTDHYTLSKKNGAVLLSGNTGSGRFVMEPLGASPQESAQIISNLLKEKKARQFRYVSLETAKILESDPSIKVELDTSILDYTYDSKQLALLATPKKANESLNLSKDLRYKRNKALEFASSNPPPQLVQAQNPALKKKAFEFLRKWEAQNQGRIGPNGKAEVLATKRMIEKMDELGLECHVLLQGEQVIGFSLGKKTGDGVFTVFAEKSLKDGIYVGAYPLLAGLQARELISRNLTKINRMDDGGEQNLRNAKLALDPLEPTPMFRVSLKER